MIICRTPFRISFFGGGTDYPIWFKDHDGAILGTTIDKYGHILVRYLPPYFEHKSKISYSKIEYVQNNLEIHHARVKECLRFMEIDEGIELYYFADLLAYKGLGTSSAFTVGLLNALHNLCGKPVEASQLASEVTDIEQYILRESVGCQDQLHAAFGGFNLIEFHKDSFSINPIKKGDLEDYLLLFDSGTYRVASDIARIQIKQTPNRVKELKQMYEMVFIARDLLKKKDMRGFGELLHENWQIKKSLTQAITTPIIDEIYNTAIKAGAIGGKLLGAGGGGYMLFFVEPEKQTSVKNALKNLKFIPFKFESKGSEIIVY